MAAQRQIPGGPYINETLNAQRQVPGAQYVNEQGGAAPIIYATTGQFDPELLITNWF